MASGERADDSAVRFIKGSLGFALGKERDAKPGCNFLEQRSAKPRFATCADHPLHAASPLFNKPKGMKSPTDYAVTQLRDTLVKILDRKPERQ